MVGINWVRVEVNWYANPKFLQLRHGKQYAAISTYFGGLGWTAAHEQDGEIPAYALGQFGGTPSSAMQLVKVGLWRKTDDGYEVNDYADYQPTRATIELKRSEGRRNAAKRWGNRDGVKVER